MLKPRFHSTQMLEAGCDEAGRGCLAGPVTAAAVILPPDFSHPMLNDSKKLNHQQRITLREIIVNHAIAWAVAHASVEEIDRLNILNASFLAMHRAIDQLQPKPQFLLIDGNRFRPMNEIPFRCIIRGDALFMSVAAASIIAKTERDRIMCELHEKFPQYDWCRNKGYPTAAHRKAIMLNGRSEHHRRTFMSGLQLKIAF